MTDLNSGTWRLQSPHGSRRRPTNPSAVDPVRTGFLPDAPTMPLVVTPSVDGADLPGWLRENRDLVNSYLHRHGALLLRGFHEQSVAEFEAAASAICPTLFREYGDLPREGDSDQIYQSTPYPEDRSILFHNESSHLDSWPMRQFFSCLLPAQAGGETPIVDCREVYRLMRPELRAQFAERKLRYVRNFIESLDVSWQRFYGTSDRTVVERKCAEAGIGFSWAPDATLRTWRVADAVLKHPRTGETVFFNQLALHHVSCLDQDTRQGLESLYGREGLPRSVYWGDGAPIDDHVVAEVRELMDRTAVAFTWQTGDVLAIDNMLVAHSRRPFTGPRKVIVALGDMLSHTELSVADA
ncbi:TauD/TfdA family dioxygenase [Streptomyces sp. BBFR51]|uniref:TauD/TfdA family dioxygenase n=1 Tax=Streptomyces sp. BBFR51 TaxID=3372856 RepID=UPI0037DD60EC